MTINIKNPDAAYKLRQVARLLGKSVSATVIELVDSRLQKIEAEKKDRARRLKAVDAIVRQINSHPPGKPFRPPAAKKSAPRRG